MGETRNWWRRKVLKKLKGEVKEIGLKLSNTEGGKEGKRKVITSCKYSEEKFQECSKKEGVDWATSVGTLGVDLRMRAKHLEGEGCWNTPTPKGAGQVAHSGTLNNPVTLEGSATNLCVSAHLDFFEGAACASLWESPIPLALTAGR